LVLILSLLALSFAAVPCGRCVGKSEVCENDFCTIEFKCTTATGSNYQTAQLCYPVVLPGAWCNGTKHYNPCQSGFSCDTITGNCEVTSAFARLNDGCLNNRYCVPGLSCQDGVCKLGSGTTCSRIEHCPWNQYCNSSSCLELPGPGASCTSSPGCKYGSSCTSSSTCVEHFSIPEFGTCESTTHCKPGFECFSKQCVKPGYHFLNGPGAVWGQECDPYQGDPGCKCNYASKIYMYLKEASVTVPEGCQNVRKDFEKCMIDRGCSAINTGADTCMRKNCYALYITQRDVCGSDVSLRPTKCGASEMIVMMLFVIIIILL